MTYSHEDIPMQDSADIELLYCNLNSTAAMIATGGIRSYSHLLNDIREDAYDGDRSGYDAGLEITPTRRLTADFALQRHAPRVDDRPFASAVHQSWAPGPHDIIANKRTPTDVAAYALMIQERRSLKTIARMSEQLGDVPAVVFPDFRGAVCLPNFSSLGISDVESQISPEVYRDLGASRSHRAMFNSLRSQGVTGVVIDTHHLQRSAVDDPELRLEPHAVLDEIEQWGAPLRRVHVSAGREDTKDDRRRADSVRDLDALLTDSDQIRRTNMGDIMERSYRIWESDRERQYALPVTVEVTYAGLCKVLGRSVKRTDFVKAHQTITANVREFFNSVNRDPKL